MKELARQVLGGYRAHGCATRGTALAFYALFVLVPIPIFAVSALEALVGGDLARTLWEKLRAVLPTVAPTLEIDGPPFRWC